MLIIDIPHFSIYSGIYESVHHTNIFCQVHLGKSRNFEHYDHAIWVFRQIVQTNWATWANLRNMISSEVTQSLKKSWSYEWGTFKLSDFFYWYYFFFCTDPVGLQFESDSISSISLHHLLKNSIVIQLMAR